MKPLPFSEDAEEALLSAAFMEPAALAKARSTIDATAFFKPAHAIFFNALCSVTDAGSVPDPVTVAEYLTGTGELKAVGGKDFIGFIIDAAPTAANVEFHAKVVREHADRRHVIHVAQQAIEGAYGLKERPDDLAQTLTAELLPVAAHTRTRGFVPIGDVLMSVLEDIYHRANTEGGMAGISWGYDALDSETGGQRAGELAFHCGVPGSAKTAFLINRCVRLAKRGVRVAVVSAEMGIKQLAERILLNEARIASKAARKGLIDPQEYDLLVRMGVELKTLPLSIDDTAQPNMRDIKAKVRALKAKHPDLQLVGVDFVQLLQDSEDANRSLELTEISYGLKALGKETETAIDVTCQVDASAIEKREDKRPQLYDLRWSQGMREAADFINLQYNTAQYEPNGPSFLEQSWRKARDLPIFTTRLRWIGEFMRVEDMLPRLAA
jgi:replicative DNA helicase